MKRRGYPAGRIKPGTPLRERVLHYAKPQASGCWEWAGYVAPKGYGYLGFGGRQVLAHRASYEVFVGAIPEGLQIDHLCRNRACVNPDHLEPVTNFENYKRSPLSRINRTHCPRGHRYDSGNTQRHHGDAPGRRCRACHNAYMEMWRATPPSERGARKAAGLPIVDLDAYFAERVPA